ncbi:MAG: CHAT domain-containing protein, partial [Pyrinomonadaceae bacterium]|nr:CHAT domain-containing protein [Pyrinomonadaceae bacterium]
MGNVFLLTSNYRQALHHYNLALEAVKPLNQRRRKRRILTNLGILYTDQGEYEKAADHFDQSKQLAIEMNDRVGAVKNLVNIAASNLMQNKYELARKAYLESLEGAEALNLREWVLVSQEGLGSVFAAQGKYELALDWLNKSLQKAEQIGNKPRKAILLWEIAKLYVSQGSYPQAIEFADRAAVLADQSMPEISYLARTIKGKAYLAQKDYRRASENLSQAIGQIEQIRTQVAGRELARQVFFESKVGPYHAMIQLLIEQNKPKSWAEALYFAEQAKGRVLLDVLRHGRVNAGATMNVVEQRRIEGRQTQSIKFEEVDTLLPNAKTALLEYVTTNDKAYLFVLTRDKDSDVNGSASVDLNLYQLKTTPEELSTLSNKFRNMLASQDTDFFTLSRQLYDLLLGPAKHQLQGRTTLGIVPDGILWNVPFQALRSAERRYVIEDHAVFYAPSLSVLHEMKSKTSKFQLDKSNNPVAKVKGGAATPTLLAFGDPISGDGKKQLVPSPNRKLTVSPTSKEKEILALRRFYGANNSAVYLKEQASEKLFKSDAGEYNVIHLATEGILDNRNPMNSYVELSKSPGDTDGDGRLEVREMMNLNLRAELVVISAC